MLRTLHCAGYNTSDTMSSLSGLWALKVVHKFLVCSSTVSGVSLEIETIATDATLLQKISYMLSWTYGSCKRK